jgi:hypothetical protein
MEEEPSHGLEYLKHDPKLPMRLQRMVPTLRSANTSGRQPSALHRTFTCRMRSPTWAWTDRKRDEFAGT